MATLTRTPTAFTAVTGSWTASSGAQLAAIQTAETVYINGAGNNDEFYAGFTAYALALQYTVSNVRISVYYRGATTLQCSLAAGIYVGSTTYYASTQTLSSDAYTTQNFDWATNPAGGNWTAAQINGLTRMYVKAVDANPDVYVSYVEITVTYDNTVTTSTSSTSSSTSNSTSSTSQSTSKSISTSSTSQSTSQSISTSSTSQSSNSSIRIPGFGGGAGR